MHIDNQIGRHGAATNFNQIGRLGAATNLGRLNTVIKLGNLEKQVIFGRLDRATKLEDLEICQDYRNLLRHPSYNQQCFSW